MHPTLKSELQNANLINALVIVTDILSVMVI